MEIFQIQFYITNLSIINSALLGPTVNFFSLNLFTILQFRLRLQKNLRIKITK